MNFIKSHTQVSKVSVVVIIDSAYLRCGAELFGQAFRVIVTSGLGRSISGMQNLVNTIRNYVCRDGLDASKVADIAANGPDLINLLILLPGENPEKFRLIDDLQD